MRRLFSLCHLSDGVHWLLISVQGGIIACSPEPFASDADALENLRSLGFI